MTEKEGPDRNVTGVFDGYADIMTTDEVAELLRLNVRTVTKLVKEGVLPAAKIANQFRFSKAKILEWIESEMSFSSAALLNELEMGLENSPMLIHRLLTPRQIVSLSPGGKEDAVRELIDTAHIHGLIRHPDMLLRRVLKREAQCSTGIGGGAAFPHPRDTDFKLVDDILLMIGVSAGGIDFEAVDGQPVYVFTTPISYVAGKINI